MQDWDVSFIKRNQITEKVTLEFRAELFNLFNHPNFSAPGTPSYAGSSSRMDFLLKREHVAVEVKMARANLRSSEQSRHLRVFDPEGRGTASSDWARFDQKRPGIQVLGQARQPAALRSEQQLEQRCKSRA